MLKPLVFAALVADISATDLYTSLRGVTFVNSGTTTAKDKFEYRTIVPNSGHFGYLEPYNISGKSKTHLGAWSQGSPFPYLYKVDPTINVTCDTSTMKGQDFKGGDSGQVILDRDDYTLCAAACCDDPTCSAFTYAVAPGDFETCKKGDFCCYKKGGSPQPVSSEIPGIVSGYATRDDNTETPPSGMRSAVPLGGISTGAVELRGDGSLHEWTIINQSPGGAAKIQNFPDAFFAVRVGTTARAMQTHPMLAGLQGVESLRYSGSYPVSKLSVMDSAFAPLANSLDLFGFSAYKANDMDASARPAIAFSLTVGSVAEGSDSADFMFQLPLNIEPDQKRAGTPISDNAVLNIVTSAECRSACNANSACLSWNFDRVNENCTLQKDAPNNLYVPGVDAGLRSSWSIDSEGQCLVLNRPGTGPANGDVSLCVSVEGPEGTKAAWSFGTSDDPSELYTRFASTGSVSGDGSKLDVANGARGAVSASVQGLSPGANATLVITFGYYFPERDQYGKVFGNQYSTLYDNSTDAAWGRVPPASRPAALAGVIADIQAVHTPFYSSSLPTAIQDQLVNSLSHIRTAMWWRECPGCHPTKDSRMSNRGFWRQWEAFDCPDLDSIHNDGERHMPYITMFPNSTRSKLAAWAANQGANGMLAEQINQVTPDKAEGRVMSDSTSMFIIYVLELYRWAADDTSLKLYWPTIKKAVEWHISTCEQFDVPYKLQTTYDVLHFPEYDVSTYSSVFHMAAMRAAAELAKAMGDTDFAQTCTDSYQRAQAALDALQWVPADGSGGHKNGYYAGGSSNCTKGTGCDVQVGFFADAFYAQVLSYSVGLGQLSKDLDKLKSHLAATVENNCKRVVDFKLEPGCPNGFITYTGRDPVEWSDWQMWQMMTHDWSALEIRTGGNVTDALVRSAGSAAAWSRVQNDQWNTAGISDTDGLPTITSHYGYAYTSWHVPLALSGQSASLLPADSAALTFDPSIETPYTLPVYLPGVLGTLTNDGSAITLALTVGSLKVKTLTVSGAAAPAGPDGFVEVAPGNPVSWSK